MNWDAVGAVAELAGAIAVVGSLVYLSRQIKMTREVDQIGVFQSIVDGFTAANDELFGPRNVALTLKGLADRDVLSPSEQVSFDVLLLNLINQGQMAAGAHVAGLLNEADMGNLEWYLSAKIFVHKGGRQWLEANESAYHSDYLEWLNKIAAKADRD